MSGISEACCTVMIKDEIGKIAGSGAISGAGYPFEEEQP